VLDLSRGIAGAYCAQLLALAGCDVVRVELDGRDERVDALAWACANRGKHERRAGNATDAMRFVVDAAALVDDRGPGGLEALGLDEVTLRQANAGLVLTRLSDFGQDGPWSNWVGSELVNLATSGMLFITGTWEQPPVQLAPYQAQMTAGLLGALASVTALYADEGVTLDLSTQEAMMSFVPLLISQYVYNGTVAAREGTAAMMTRIERAADDWVYAGPGAAVNADYATFARFLEIPELGEERFLTPDGRLANWEEHQRLVLPKLLERTREAWLARAEEWHLTFAPVYTATELLSSDVLGERGFFAPLSPAQPEVRVPLAPYVTDGVRPDALARPLVRE